MDISQIYIKDHALEQFKERWKKFYKTSPPKDCLNSLINFLSNVREIKKIPKLRLAATERYGRISRHFLEMRGQNWIFVTNENLTTLYTVELMKSNLQSWAMPKGVRRKIVKKRKK